MALPAGIVLVSDSWALAGADLDFGASLSGREQVVSAAAPLWAARLSFRVPQRNSTAWLDWLAWIEERSGRLVADEITPRPARRAGSAVFGTTLTADANQFATEIEVSGTTGFAPGLFIWIGGTMHRIVAVTGNTVTIQPGLRAPRQAGAAIYGNGSLRMTLAAPGDGGIALSRDPVVRPSLTLIETIDPES